MKTYSEKDLSKMRVTKEQLAELLGLDKKVESYDVALPQGWLNAITAYSKLSYRLIAATTFWVYDKPSDIFGYPVSGCREVQTAIDGFEF